MHKLTMFGAAAAVTIGLTVAASAPSSAHHSGAAYDRSKQTTVEGEVKEWRWSNPHAWLQIYVPGAEGDKVLWSFEATSPNILLKQGFTRTGMKPGDKVQVTFFPLGDGGPGGSLVRIKKDDGTVMGAPEKKPTE
jgi:Family of unknown function (DUF6152)